MKYLIMAINEHHQPYFCRNCHNVVEGKGSWYDSWSLFTSNGEKLNLPRARTYYKLLQSLMNKDIKIKIYIYDEKC